MEPSGFRFILDAHLGKLARYLRLCGFDSLFSPEIDDSEIMSISVSEGRIIVTRDKLLANNRKADRSLLIRSQVPEEQLKELFSRYDLKDHFAPFSRCLECNSTLEKIDKEMIADRLEPRTLKYYNNFRICKKCDHIYWEGSHFERMNKFILKLINENP